MTVDMTKCSAIMNYEGDQVYQPVKNPITGKWEDQTAQSIKNNYKQGFNCPCKAYLNEHCNENYPIGLYFVKKFSYFVSKHKKSIFHTRWLDHKNTTTSALEANTNKELVDRIEELEREKRKDKVDFREYLQLQEKRYTGEIENLKEKIILQEQLITSLQPKNVVPVANLIDI
jgi:hypothetical protein